ncbi:zinc finger protein [Culex quinquefasciatus]|uniref:Zinc finger protein n=1 Tax=Culex quinquefasciatus TaxID=7176 RepID=B0X4U7_CULQU|nr:zinc finger protein [Culex quinquefasciatus]|eukprot:XP_001864669.1 zinc finger protein [Culex quinquefasciatus]
MVSLNHPLHPGHSLTKSQQEAGPPHPCTNQVKRQEAASVSNGQQKKSRVKREPSQHDPMHKGSPLNGSAMVTSTHHGLNLSSMHTMEKAMQSGKSTSLGSSSIKLGSDAHSSSQPSISSPMSIPALTAGLVDDNDGGRMQLGSLGDIN